MKLFTKVCPRPHNSKTGDFTFLIVRERLQIVQKWKTLVKSMQNELVFSVKYAKHRRSVVVIFAVA